MKPQYTFDELFSDETKRGTKIPASEYKTEGKYPIIDQGKGAIAGYIDEAEGLFTDVPAIIFGDHTRIVKYVDVPFFIGADGVKILSLKKAEDNSKYFYYALKNARIPDTGYNRHFKWLREQKFLRPAIDDQNIIVERLDATLHLINSTESQLAKLDTLVKSRFIEMFGDPVMNPMGWEKVTLGNLSLKANNGMSRRGNDADGNIVLRLVELQSGMIDYSSPNRIKLTDTEMKRYQLHDKDFLFARVNGNPENVGRCAAFREISELVFHNDHIIRYHFDEERVNGIFLSILMNSPYGKNQLKPQIKTSAGQYTVSQSGIDAIEIPLPPIALQNQFATFVQQVDKSKSVLQKLLEKQETLRAALMQEYFG